MQLAASEGINIIPEQLLVGKDFTDFNAVVQANPYVIIIHFSSFFWSDKDSHITLKERKEAHEKFQLFVDYVASARPSVKFLIYTRTTPKYLKQHAESLPKFGGRVRVIYLPWTARFDQPAVMIQ